MSRTHCKHGVYVGHPGGPDYMCGYCEDGVTDEEWEAHKKWEASTRRQLAKEQLSYVVQGLRSAYKEITDPVIISIGERAFVNIFCENGATMRAAQAALQKVKLAL